MRQWRFSGENAKIPQALKICPIACDLHSPSNCVLYVCFVFHLQKSGATFSCGVLRKNSEKATSVAKKVRDYRTSLLKIHYRTPDTSVLF